MSNKLIYLNIIVSTIAVLIGIVGLILILKKNEWKKLFSQEEQPENLEDIITIIGQKIKNLQEKQQETTEHIKQISEVLNTAFKKIGVIRFDSTGDDGGNLSFSIALLNSHNSGIIITSLHGRQHNRIYCKQVENSGVIQTLSNEEQQALQIALN